MANQNNYLLIYLFLLILGRNDNYFAFGYSSTSESYDFIVVGAGTGGCVMASRLSQSGKHSVLLLEAGGYPDPRTEVPALDPGFIGSPDHSKHYRTVRQENAGLQTNGSITYIIGRVLGGGSTINGMVFNRGNPNDYRIWEKRTGDPTWNYQSLMKYFKRAEDYLGDFPSDQHGFGGPIPISSPARSHYAPLQKTYYEAGRSLGYTIADPNGPQRISFAPSETSKRRGRRVSSYKGYLANVLNSRNNLKIITNAFARRIIFEGNKAVGIVYVSGYNNSLGSGNEDVIVRANKEIIISSGAIESPILLQRSGIGPEDVLKENGITPVKILPGVGRNLQDHTLVRLEFRINDDSDVFIVERDLTPENFAYYNLTGNGPYSTIDGVFTQTFMVSPIAYRNEGSGAWPDIFLQLFSGPGTVGNRAGMATDTPSFGKVSVLVNLFLARPKSAGYVKLNVTNPEGDPEINFRYLTHLDDSEVMLDGIKKALEIYEKTPAFQRLGGRFRPPPLPACDSLPFRSDDYWRCLIRHRALTGLHGAGTCAMGRGANDPNSVVDSTLKVIGVERLRVVDASVMPKVTNANLEAPIYAIAEKASEMILQQYQSSSSQWPSPSDGHTFNGWGGWGNMRY